MLQKDPLFRRREETPYRPPAAPVPHAAPAPSAGAAAAPDVAGTGKAGEASKLVVGPEVKLKGAEISDCDTLVVEGRVESALDSRVMQIAEKGVFKGAAAIDIAEIRGRFEGELTARKNLVIHATGRVSGKIRYGRIKVEEGAEIAGDVAPIGAPGEAAARPLTPQRSP